MSTSTEDGRHEFYGDKQEPIAIVGASCRFPGEATSMRNLWDMIRTGKQAHSKVPSDRFDADAWYHPDPDRKGTLNVKHGAFLKEDVSLWDAPFFGITSTEAAGMDPMKRLLLEVSYECFESAGIPVETLMNTQTGCYVGCMTNDYETLSTRDINNFAHVAASGNSQAMIANRLSWYFGLRGPSLTLDTACSASLYALHLACQSLRLGETNMALVSGVNLILYPAFMHQLTAMHMLSPDGTSHTFDDRANGYGRGEGIGAVVVKRLSDALRDGDTIRAVIRGIGANVDGKTPSITMPSSEAQAELIRRTYEAAGLSYDQTGYFETHGTGTPVGDPIELQGITSTIGVTRSSDNPLYIGSIKPTVGHTEGCSGLAGLFKALHCIEQGVLVPTAGFHALNPALKLADWNLTLPTENMSWPTPGLRRASVASFGFGGSNAHVILDDAYHYLKERNLVGNHTTVVDPAIDSGFNSDADSQSDARFRIFAITAKDQAGLNRISSSLHKHLTEQVKLDQLEPEYIDDLAFTLAHRRTQHPFRSSFVADSLESLCLQLAKNTTKTRRIAKHNNNIFIFTGQGAQWAEMGVALLDIPVFKQSIQQTQQHLNALGCAWNVAEELSRSSDSNIDKPEYSQTLCLAVQIALVQLLESWNIRPRAVVGHSSGEIAAAYAAKLISHYDAVCIAYQRGVCSGKVESMSQPARPGAMMAAGLSESEAQVYIDKIAGDSVVVACVNSPVSVTLSGDEDAIIKLEQAISKDDKFARRLRVQTAYHSPHMLSVKQMYHDLIKDVRPLSQTEDEVLFFSSVTGKVATAADVSPSYWIRNMCGQVKFAEALSSVLEHTIESSPRRRKIAVSWSSVLEVGPHSALQGPISQVLKASKAKVATELQYTSTLYRGRNGIETAMQAAGSLWRLGQDVDLRELNSQYDGHHCKALADLPAYPWDHSKGYWHESRSTRSIRFPSAQRNDFLGIPVENQNALAPLWKNHIRISENPWIEQHSITGTILYPAAGMLIMVIEAAVQIAARKDGIEAVKFHNVSFERGLVFTSPVDPVEVSLSVQLNGESDLLKFTVFSQPPDGIWTKHCSGTFQIVPKAKDNKQETQSAVSKIDSTNLASGEEVDINQLYDRLEEIGMQYGELFRNVVKVTALPEKHECFGSVKVPDTKSQMPFEFEYPHVIHPATLDAIFHLLFVTFGDGVVMTESAVPYTLEYMYVATNLPKGPGVEFKGHASRVRQEGRETAGDIVVSASSDEVPQIIIRNFTMRQVTASSSPTQDAMAGGDCIADRCSTIVWKEHPGFLLAQQPAVSTSSHPKGQPSTLNKTALKWWAERFCDVCPNSKALLLVDEQSLENVREFLLAFGPQVESSPSFAQCQITSISPFDSSKWPASIQELLSSSTGISIVQPENVDQNSVLISFSKIALNDLRTFIAQTKAENVVLSAESTSTGAGIDSSSSEFSPDVKAAGLQAVISTPDIVVARPQQDINVKQAFILLPQRLSAQVVSFVASLSEHLQTKGLATQIISTADLKQVSGQHVISLLEIEDPFIRTLRQDSFEHTKILLGTAKNVLWITRGAQNLNVENIDFAPSIGFLRVIRNEYPQLELSHLDVSQASHLGDSRLQNLIAEVWCRNASAYPSNDKELAESNGTILVPRLQHLSGFNEELEQRSGKVKAVRGAVDTTRPLVLDANLVFSNDLSLATKLADTEVEVRIQQFTINHLDSEDTQSAQKRLREAVGIITKIGKQVQHLDIGQRVALLHSGKIRTHVRQTSDLVVPVGDSFTEDNLASLQDISAAWYTLMEASKLSKDQRVLIHGADGSMARALLSICDLVGAQTFVSVDLEASSDPYLRTAKHKLINSRSADFANELFNRTSGHRIDLILSTDPTSLPMNCTSVLADFGSLVLLSDSRDSNNGSSLALPSNTRMMTIDYDAVSISRFDIAARVLQDASALLAAPKSESVKPCTKFSVTELSKAIDHVGKHKQERKVVVEVEPGAVVSMEPSPLPSHQLDGEGTYILAGGLGALGLDIARHMLEHGAGHLVIFSRSGGNADKLREFVDAGYKIESIKCDITDEKSVKASVQTLLNDKRQIKGLVQSAMVLDDGIFETMPLEQWQRTTRPKIEGTWNLHENLPKDLDFFIMLSSVVAVTGNPSQANYAAGNTYQDVFAQYRRKQGLAATTINVGIVADSAHFIAENNIDAYIQKYRHLAPLLTHKQEVLETLALAMHGKTMDGSPVPSQVILGVTSSLSRAGAFAGTWTEDHKFNNCIRTESGLDDSSSAKLSPRTLLQQATTVHEAVDVVGDFLKHFVAAATGSSADSIDAEKPLFDFGIDSLKAVELRNKAYRELDTQVSVFEILSSLPIHQLAQRLTSRSSAIANSIAGQAAEELSIE